MWYAPIGSLEYTKILHNDILIKRYILSEQRLKQQNSTLANKYSSLNTKSRFSKKHTEIKKKRDSKMGEQKTIDTRKNRIKGCAVDIIIKRSFRKTVLDVVTYDSTKKIR